MVIFHSYFDITRGQPGHLQPGWPLCTARPARKDSAPTATGAYSTSHDLSHFHTPICFFWVVKDGKLINFNIVVYQRIERCYIATIIYNTILTIIQLSTVHKANPCLWKPENHPQVIGDLFLVARSSTFLILSPNENEDPPAFAYSILSWNLSTNVRNCDLSWLCRSTSFLLFRKNSCCGT